MKIVINGKSYSSLDDLPPEVRQDYAQAMSVLADKNHNGLPDILEGLPGMGSADTQTSPITFSSTQIIVDGKEYSNLAELPPEARQKYEQALAQYGQALSGLEEDMAAPNPGGATDVFESARTSQSVVTQNPMPSVGREPTRPYGKGLLVIAILVVAMLIILSALGAVLPRLFQIGTGQP